MSLREVRELAGKNQVDVAAAMEKAQGEISKIIAWQIRARRGARPGRRQRNAAGHQRQVQLRVPNPSLTVSIADGSCWMTVPSAPSVISWVSQVPDAMA
jgi:hypothetical protein